MKTEIDALLEKLRFHGFDAERISPLWNECIAIESRLAELPPPAGQYEIYGIKSQLACLMGENPKNFASIKIAAQRLIEAEGRDKKHWSMKRALLKKQREAHIAAARATHRLLGDEIERCGKEMAKIAEANATFCTSAPPLLPPRIRELFDRARCASRMRGESLLTGIEPELGERVLLSGPLSFIRRELQPGVRAFCCVAARG